MPISYPFADILSTLMFFEKLIYFSSLFAIQRVYPSVKMEVTIISGQIVEKHRAESRNSESHIAFVVSSTSEFSGNMTMVFDLTDRLTETFPTNMTIGGIIELFFTISFFHPLRIFDQITHFSDLGL